MSTVPIALFTYARPDHLAKTLEGLRQNNVPLIYAFSDGAKTSDKQEKVTQVRQLLHSIDWCDIKIIERDENLGLGPSIRQGVSQVLDEFEEVIVVEDDIVFKPGAYKYVVEALAAYRDNKQVMSISMWTHPSITPSGSNGFFSKRFVCWGWATYRDDWRKYINTPLELYQECTQKKVECLDWGKDLKEQAETAQKRNLWYVGYALLHFLEGKLSYFPSQSLVVNIGFDGTGENCGNNAAISTSQEELRAEVSQQTTWPAISLPKGLSHRFANYFSPRPSFIIRLKIRAKKISKRLVKMTGLY